MIRLSKSCIGEEEKSAVRRVLDKEFLGMGQEVGEFEVELGRFFERSVACVINGTAALHLALQACHLTTGDEVLVPSLTYLSCFQTIVATGATPVACDVDPTTLCIDPTDAAKRICSRTKVIMPVHYTGSVCNLDAIYTLADSHNLRVIEDAAHAFGSNYKGRKVGSFGDIACFSFDGIKNITSGEGGCVVTHDEEVLGYIKDARLLGVKNDTGHRLLNKRSWDFDVESYGWRYHMSNIMAAIGLVQLKRIDELGDKRKSLAGIYDRLFQDCDHISPVGRDNHGVIPHIYVVRIKNLTDRKTVREQLFEAGIETGIHYYPNHYLSLFGGGKQSLPVTEQAFPELLTLPLHPDLSQQDIEMVVSELNRLI